MVYAAGSHYVRRASYALPLRPYAEYNNFSAGGDEFMWVAVLICAVLYVALVIHNRLWARSVLGDESLGAIGAFAALFGGMFVFGMERCLLYLLIILTIIAILTSLL